MSTMLKILLAISLTLAACGSSPDSTDAEPHGKERRTEPLEIPLPSPRDTSACGELFTQCVDDASLPDRGVICWTVMGGTGYISCECHALQGATHESNFCEFQR